MYIRWYNMWQYRNLPVKKITREIGREISVVMVVLGRGENFHLMERVFELNSSVENEI